GGEYETTWLALEFLEAVTFLAGERVTEMYRMIFVRADPGERAAVRGESDFQRLNLHWSLSAQRHLPQLLAGNGVPGPTRDIVGPVTGHAPRGRQRHL